MRVGVDIGGTKTLAAALADDDSVLDVRVLPTVRGPRGVLDTAALVVAEVTDGVRPRSIGVGIPGVVDPATGVVRTAVNLDLDALPLGAALADRTGVPVRVENDVNAGALGAALRFGGTGEALTYLAVGTGVGAATVVRGELLRGAAGWAGELGHLVVDPGGDTCGCGQRGCLETLVGGAAVARRLAALDVPLTLPGLFVAGARPAVVAERDRLLGALALGLTTAAVAYDPDVIVVGGGVLTHAPALLPCTLELLRQRAAGSPFLTGLAVDRRVRAVPADWPVAAVGAALVGETAIAPERAPA
jgi:glucokinase